MNLSTQHDDFVKAGNGKSQEEADHEMQARIEDDVKNILLPMGAEARCCACRPVQAGRLQVAGQSYGQVRDYGPDGDSGSYWPQRLLWIPMVARARMVEVLFGQRPVEGRPFGRLCCPPSGQEHSGSRSGVGGAGTAGLCHWRGPSDEPYINTYGTSTLDISDGEMANRILKSDPLICVPKPLEERLQLRNPIYEETACLWPAWVAPSPGEQGRACGQGGASDVRCSCLPGEQTDRSLTLSVVCLFVMTRKINGIVLF